VFARYIEAAPAEWRADIEDPVLSRWYPERMMLGACSAFYEAVAARDDNKFNDAMEACTVLGTHWFVQMLASVTTPRYLLRLLPAALRQVRRGPVRLALDLRERDATLTFQHHPFADDHCYRLATPAIMRAILRLCVGQTARATLVGFDKTTQVVKVGW
jgi:hypothetical protein